MLRGRLLTGRLAFFLRHEVDSGRAQASPDPLWWPPVKVSGRFLTPYLDARGLAHLPLTTPPPNPAIHVHVPLSWHEPQADDVLGLDTLGGPVAARRR